MASIRPLKRKGGTKYRVYIRRKGKQPVSKVFDLKTDARKWAQVMEGSDAHLDAYPDAEARRRTLADVIDALKLSGRLSSKRVTLPSGLILGCWSVWRCLPALGKANYLG